MINLVSTHRERRTRQRTAARILATSLRLSASELEDIAKAGAVEPDEMAAIIKRIRDDAQLLDLAGGAA